MNDLNAQLLAAHTADDKTGLIALYTLAANQSETVDEACFFLTHAYVFALEIGDHRSIDLRHELALHGRETPTD